MNEHLKRFLFVVGFCIFISGCATAAPTQSSNHVRAHYVITATDDFIINVYQNGVLVPDSKRELVAEIFGATVERINIEVQKGDWLVFNVVSDRMRWGGAQSFIAAGVLATNKFGFVTTLSSGNWSVCDDFNSVSRFIAEKDYDHDHRPISADHWEAGIKCLKQYAGDEWKGEPLWGWSPNTWIKVNVK